MTEEPVKTNSAKKMIKAAVLFVILGLLINFGLNISQNKQIDLQEDRSALNKQRIELLENRVSKLETALGLATPTPSPSPTTGQDK
jgi:hypothetical protein